MITAGTRVTGLAAVAQFAFTDGLAAGIGAVSMYGTVQLRCLTIRQTARVQIVVLVAVFTNASSVCFTYLVFANTRIGIAWILGAGVFAVVFMIASGAFVAVGSGVTLVASTHDHTAIIITASP